MPVIIAVIPDPKTAIFEALLLSILTMRALIAIKEAPYARVIPELPWP